MKKMFLMWFDGESTAPSSTINAEAADAAADEVGSQTSAEFTKGETHAPSLGEGTEESYHSFKERFKNEYQADLQRVIDKRFKNAKKVEAERDALRAKSEQFEPLMHALYEKYGTEAPEELINRVLQETHPHGEAAGQKAEKGAADNNTATAPDAEESERLQAQIVEHWQAEADALKDLYPAFSLEEEIENDRFSTALQSGMSVRDAYQYAHFDEILSGVIQYTAQGVKNSMQAARAVRSARPAENGTRSGAAAVVKSDVSKLSKADIEEINQRVLRGERIIF
jgi:hypothetical protein